MKPPCVVTEPHLGPCVDCFLSAALRASTNTHDTCTLPFAPCKCCDAFLLLLPLLLLLHILLPCFLLLLLLLHLPPPVSLLLWL
jgi:hypothetical protein